MTRPPPRGRLGELNGGAIRGGLPTGGLIFTAPASPEHPAKLAI